jgi:hypothetical protein
MANRKPGDGGIGWHSHGAKADAGLPVSARQGFIRVFFYFNGFAVDDGNLKAVPGSHLLADRHDPAPGAKDDADLAAKWLRSGPSGAFKRP